MTTTVERAPLVNEMRLRISQAASKCAHLSCRSAILPEPIQVLGYDLSSLLMGMSVDVFHGPQMSKGVISPPVLVDIGRLECSNIKHKILLIKSIHPTSAVCVITGLSEKYNGPAFNPDADYDDVRACLLAAGIGFLTKYEVLDAAEA
jgi:hypothetical protein